MKSAENQNMLTILIVFHCSHEKISKPLQHLKPAEKIITYRIATRQNRD